METTPIENQIVQAGFPPDPALPANTITLEQIAGWDSQQRLEFIMTTRSKLMRKEPVSDEHISLAIACNRLERTGGANKAAGAKKPGKAPVAAMSIDEL